MSARLAVTRPKVLVNLYVLGLILLVPRGLLAAIYLPPCTLENDPAIRVEYFSTCLEGQIGAWVEQRSKVEDGVQPPYLYAGKGRVTTLVSSWLTLQAAGHYRVLQSRKDRAIVNRDAEADTLLAQIGNSSVYRHRLFAGKSAPPFGLDFNTLGDWSGFDTSRYFFSRPVQLAGYTYDNQRDTTWVIAGGENQQLVLGEDKRITILSTRLAYDFAALEGTRMVASFSSTSLSARRGGIALLNRNGKGEQTSMEVVRKWKEFPYDPNDFDQLLRVNWSGKASEESVFKAQYEDIWKVSRIGTLSLVYTFFKPLSGELHIGYYKTENAIERNHWFGVLGVGASL